MDEELTVPICADLWDAYGDIGRAGVALSDCEEPPDFEEAERLLGSAEAIIKKVRERIATCRHPSA